MHRKAAVQLKTQMNRKTNIDAIRCFDIGGSKIVAADVSACGQVQVHARMATPTDNFDQFTQSLADLCSENGEPISISIAGVIDPATGRITSANIPCINDRVLATELSTKLGRSVCLINDANAFALAEAKFGQAKNHKIVLAIILGTGVGGAIVINGRLLTGDDGNAGEWAHSPASAMRTNSTLPVVRCNCGQQSCLDTLGGARGLERIYKHLFDDSKDSHRIIQHWLDGEANARQAIDVWLDVVGGSLAGVVNLLSPSIIAVGGGLAGSSPLISALDKEVDKRRLVRKKTALLYSAVSGPEQGLVGAALHLLSTNN